MANRSARRRTAPKRALIGPLVMLASGAAVGVLMWRFLMLEPAPSARVRAAGVERLSHHDRQALERLLGENRAHP
jgi:uncharacterized membrane protein